MEGAEAAAAFPYRELRDGDINALHAWLARGGRIDAPLLSSVAETWTPLMLACAQGDPRLARTIVQSGGARASARVGTKVLASPAPLHVAARYGHAAVAKTLLDLGAAVDARDTIGMTPLHYGAGNGHMKIAQVLLDAGAEASAESPGGATPSDMAEFGGFEDVAGVLKTRVLKGEEAGAANRRALLAWLEALGCEEFLARFLTAGYDDLGFMASHGLTEADLDCVGVPREKLGLRKKLLAMHGVELFLPVAEGREEHDGSVAQESVPSSSDDNSSDGDASDAAGDDNESNESSSNLHSGGDDKSDSAEDGESNDRRT